jgi:hypothetical protein
MPRELSQPPRCAICPHIYPDRDGLIRVGEPFFPLMIVPPPRARLSGGGIPIEPVLVHVACTIELIARTVAARVAGVRGTSGTRRRRPAVELDADEILGAIFAHVFGDEG